MHHIILITIGSAGDVHPILALGKTLHQRGHRVSVMTNAYFRKQIAATGLEFLTLGTEEEYLQVENNPQLWDPMKGFQVVAEEALLPAVRPVYEHLRRYDPASTLVAATSICFGARIAQEQLGFRLATLALQPCVFRSVHRPPVFQGLFMPDWMPRWLKRTQYNLADRLMVDRILCPPINAFRSELGLPPVRHIFGNWLHSPDQSIGLFPDWFGPRQPDWPPQTNITNFVLYDDGERNEIREDLRTFLKTGKPPIVFAPGSAMRHADDFFREAVEAAGLLRRRAILLSGRESQVPANLPDTVLWRPYIPFGFLFQHAAAVVHHGGIGTTAQALTAGLPQLVMPMAHDQVDNADRVRQLGAGLVVSRDEYKARPVAELLYRVTTSNDILVRCREYAMRLEGNTGVEETCKLIEGLVK